MRCPSPRLGPLVCLFVASLALVAASAAAASSPKVKVCHIPPGNPANFHTITISANALPAHLAHGDLPGSCFANCDTLCSDGDPCTIDACDPATEQCAADHPPVNCNDGNLCTVDSCSAEAGGCVYQPVICMDDDNCTVDACDPMTGTCVAPPAECPDGQSCDPASGDCVDEDPCASDPCINGFCSPAGDGCLTAFCTPPPGGDFVCNCDPGWTGIFCEIDIDECASSPCVFGDCIDEVNGYSCVCLPGYGGTNCDVPDDPCTPDPCVNGVCSPAGGGCLTAFCTPAPGADYVCDCDAGWSGTECDVPTQPTYSCATNDPCTPENIDQGLFYFPHADPSTYIQCSEYGQCFEEPCPSGLVWSQPLLTCIFP